MTVKGGRSSRCNIFCSLVCACQLSAGPEFAVETEELDPQFFGFPVRRPRQYAVCILKEAATILDRRFAMPYEQDIKEIESIVVCPRSLVGT